MDFFTDGKTWEVLIRLYTKRGKKCKRLTVEMVRWIDGYLAWLWTWFLFWTQGKKPLFCHQCYQLLNWHVAESGATPRASREGRARRGERSGSQPCGIYILNLCFSRIALFYLQDAEEYTFWTCFSRIVFVRWIWIHNPCDVCVGKATAAATNATSNANDLRTVGETIDWLPN